MIMCEVLTLELERKNVRNIGDLCKAKYMKNFTQTYTV